ncbi:cilia- and flagella-associated protein 20-like [Pseudomyrmex gracilis]|uniref:cilia- and flagella-associated protein 20-like n=1 Tax=Pseudomyrmex gracilis TaxID=219809 RepID=UPI000995998C|nr:cilia- and flagella-associated protein 20-like [Pseudomyrmex gracilis]
MFRNTYQGSFLSILYSCGSSPLELWGMRVRNGYIRRVTDEEIKSLALEVSGTNVATTYIFCPADPKKVLAIRLPFLIIIIKNMKKYFTFEITILDDKDMHRRFRVSNFQSTTRVRPFCTSMPIGLENGWNQIQFNLCDFTRRAYGTNYIETTRMQIHANCRIRRIYFADRLYSEDELPEDFKLFFPVHRKKCVREEMVLKKPSIVPEPPPIVAEELPVEPEIEKPIEMISEEIDLAEVVSEMYPEEEEMYYEEEEIYREEEEEEEEEEREKEEEREEEEEEEIKETEEVEEKAPLPDEETELEEKVTEPIEPLLEDEDEEKLIAATLEEEDTKAEDEE